MWCATPSTTCGIRQQQHPVSSKPRSIPGSGLTMNVLRHAPTGTHRHRRVGRWATAALDRSSATAVATSKGSLRTCLRKVTRT